MKKWMLCLLVDGAPNTLPGFNSPVAAVAVV
ncbi:hypothetical protein SCARR_02525 [Pontiella sulfatireligans]|uniref:Uncharacterized protein n=1 Tax=Pontiella sulfatireligans TaxID=2750658 RepID=A0A6C2UJQ3_9BACT|nr:hypothetical protein SCARR_02525 [Pontiella sulfatireligans]